MTARQTDGTGTHLHSPFLQVFLYVDDDPVQREARASGYEFAFVQKSIHPTKLVEAIQNL